MEDSYDPAAEDERHDDLQRIELFGENQSQNRSQSRGENF